MSSQNDNHDDLLAHLQSDNIVDHLATPNKKLWLEARSNSLKRNVTEVIEDPFRRSLDRCKDFRESLNELNLMFNHWETEVRLSREIEQNADQAAQKHAQDGTALRQTLNDIDRLLRELEAGMAANVEVDAGAEAGR